MCQFCDFTFFGLAEPQPAMLESYVAALKQGWSASNIRSTSGEQLAAIAADPDKFLADLVAPAGTVNLPDGRTVPRLPWRVRWMWDGEFCGAINLRWPEDKGGLPEHVLGHIGYSVVPWKRRHGYATRALRAILADAREVGLERVLLTTDPDNDGSQKVMLANGAERIGEIDDVVWGTGCKQLFEIRLGGGGSPGER